MHNPPGIHLQTRNNRRTYTPNNPYKQAIETNIDPQTTIAQYHMTHTYNNAHPYTCINETMQPCKWPLKPHHEELTRNVNATNETLLPTQIESHFSLVVGTIKG